MHAADAYTSLLAATSEAFAGLDRTGNAHAGVARKVVFSFHLQLALCCNPFLHPVAVNRAY